MSNRTLLATASVTAALALAGTAAFADFVINDDLIVDGSACIGFDCVNGESFGFDTLRLKENNLRIHFDDTSIAASFPRNDWRIIVNDTANGGASKFSVEDSTGGRTPFTITAGARSNALFVDSQGDVGIGTSTPATDIDIKTGDTPTVRLQQDGSSGFASQTWDMAGNETSFFIRDVSNGSTLPFRIMGGGAPSQSLVIDDTGFVGIGAGTSPDVKLHVQESSTGAGNATLLLLENSGGRPRLQLTGTGTPGQTGDWSISAGNTVVLQDRTNGDNEMIIDQSGNMTILGSLTENSDKNSKMAIVPVEADEILDKVAALPISAWTYKNDAERGIRHIGPMAQDFYAAFGTGASPRGISTIDTSGVALAAIKALSQENNALKARIEALETLVVQRD